MTEHRLREILSKTERKGGAKPPKQEEVLDLILDQLSTLNGRVRMIENVRRPTGIDISIPASTRHEVERLVRIGVSEQDIVDRLSRRAPPSVIRNYVRLYEQTASDRGALTESDSVPPFTEDP